MEQVTEILQYTLKPGAGKAFHYIMEKQSAPLHKECGLNIRKFGNSMHDPDCYYLIRTFPSQEKMEEQLEKFYNDLRWRTGPRKAIIEMIATSHRVVIPDIACSSQHISAI